MPVQLEDILDNQLSNDYWVFPHSNVERYCHRGPVIALVGAYGTMGSQGNLMRLFSSPRDVNHQFRQEEACSLALSIGRGYQSPWNRREEENDDGICQSIDDGIGQCIDDDQDNNDLHILVHLVY